jgi:hypothetical protein
LTGRVVVRHPDAARPRSQPRRRYFWNTLTVVQRSVLRSLGRGPADVRGSRSGGPPTPRRPRRTPRIGAGSRRSASTRRSSQRSRRIVSQVDRPSATNVAEDYWLSESCGERCERRASDYNPRFIDSL